LQGLFFKSINEIKEKLKIAKKAFLTWARLIVAMPILHAGH
jgi:hypothetical protein